MKTINYLRQYIPVLTISIILVASTVDANAQKNKSDDRNKKMTKTEYRKSDRNYKKTSQNNWRNDQGESHEKQNWNSYDNRKDYHPMYSSKMYKGHSNYFNHPKYGHVYSRFDRNPIVFRHNHDNYYYYGNNFYTYRKGVGYCVIAPPRNVYFNQLPETCRRVFINGQAYYRSGELYFQQSPRGYAIVPTPFHVQFSVRF